MKDLLRQAGLEGVEVASAALHTDEIGSDVHSGTRRVLTRHGVQFTRRRAWLLTAETAHAYDLLIGMDAANVADLRRVVRPEDRTRIHKLLAFAGSPRDIADPWYTGDFDATYDDVRTGCTALVESLREARGA